MNDLFSSAGRSALVTGGWRGIGRMIAAGFRPAGARVYISARKVPAATRTNVRGVRHSSACSIAGTSNNSACNSTECASSRPRQPEGSPSLLMREILIDRYKGIEAAPANARSWPFLVPDHPISPTVRTSCEASERRNRLGTDSSSSRRIGRELLSCRLEHSNSPFPGDQGEVLKELLKGGSALEVPKQTLHRHACAREAECSAHDLGISTDKRCTHA